MDTATEVAGATSAQHVEPGGEGLDRLRRILQANAGFSALTGVVATLFASPVAERLGLDGGDTPLLRAMGLGLLLYAAGLVATSKAAPRRTVSLALPIAVADLAWVAATALLVVAGVFSTTGAVVAGIVAADVLSFGVVQLRQRSRVLRELAAAT